MNTSELKINLINRITSLTEVHIIEQIQKLIDFELDKDVYKLNSNQRERIIEAQKDEILSEKQADKEVEEWLNEK